MSFERRQQYENTSFYFIFSNLISILNYLLALSCYWKSFILYRYYELVKKPDNEHDKEAIKVELEGLGKIGYVANSTYSVLGESISAGRLYDRIDDVAYGVIKYVLPRGILCELTEKNIEKMLIM